MTSLEFVAFDLETTGFAVSDSVTVVGFALPMGVRVFCQTNGRPASGLEATVRDRTNEHSKVTTHASETALLEGVGAFTAERLSDDDALLVAFNGETWKAGFDLPFLRTRLSVTGVEWPFSELPYADIMPVVTNRFNTTIDADGKSREALGGVYEMLCDGGCGELDPFEDSVEAVSAFDDGRFADLVMHNVADVLRTRRLGLLAERYCSKSDFTVKSLTPTIDA